MKNRHHLSREDIQRIIPDELDLFRKDLKQIRDKELQPLLGNLTAVREDAYKRGFWLGVLVAGSLILAGSFAGVFLGL